MAAKNKPVVVKILGDARPLKAALSTAEKAMQTMAVAAGAAGLAAGGALMLGLNQAMENQAGVALTAAQFGLSPEEAERIGRIGGEAYASGWGDSLHEASAAAAELDRASGGIMSDAQLEGITSNLLALEDAFGITAQESTLAIQNLVNAGLVDSFEEGADFITTLAQQMPAALRDEIIPHIDEYTAQIEGIGLSHEQLLQMMMTADSKFELDKTLDAFGEIQKRVTTLDTNAVATLDAIGLSGEEMSRKFAEGGPEAAAAMAEIAQRLLEIEDPAERNRLAIQLLGTQIEDLGVENIGGFLEDAAALDSSLVDIEGSADSLSDTLGGTAAARIESFKRKALMGLANFVAETLLPRFESFIGWVEEVWPKVEEFISPIIESIKETANNAIDAIAAFWDEHGETILEAAETLWDGIQEGFNELYEFVDETLLPIFEEIAGWISDNWETIEEVFDTVADAVSTAVQKLGEFGSWIRQNDPVIAGLTATVIALGIAKMVTLVPAIIATTAALWAQAAATLAAYGPILIVIGAIGLLVGALVYAYQNVDWFRNAVDTAGKFIKENFVPFLKNMGEIFVWVWDKAKGIGEFIGRNLPKLIDKGKTVWNTLKNVFARVRDTAQTVWDKLKSIGEFVKDVFVAHVNAGKAVIDKLKSAFNGVKNAGQWVWDKLKELGGYLEDGFGTAVDVGKGVIQGLTRAMNGVKNAVQWAWDKFKEIASYIGGGIFSTAVAAGTAVIDGLKSAFDNVKSAVQFVIDKVEDLIGWIGKIPGIPGFDSGVNGRGFAQAAQTAVNEVQPRAFGGPIRPGKTYLVGERGPESLVIPNSLGGAHVISNREMRGGYGGDINVFMSGSNVSPYEVGAEISWVLRRGGGR